MWWWRLLLVVGCDALTSGGMSQRSKSVSLKMSKEEASIVSKGAWAAAEVFGRIASRKDAVSGQDEGEAPRSREEVIRRIRADYEKSPPYFLSGNFDRYLYDEDCLFADDFASFKGRQRFEENLANLGGFITESYARQLGEEKIEENSYEAKFLVRLRLGLPWSPVLAWPWGVRHVWDDETFAVVEHIESWDVSPGEGVRQTFTPGKDKVVVLPEKKKSNALGSKDPIAGPLVDLARRLGALPESEEGGWTGEPLAWADRDSFTQKLSEFTQGSLKGFKQFVAEAVAGDFDAAAVDQTIDDIVESNSVVMFSFTSCPFCKKAKDKLDSLGTKYASIELDEDPLGPAIRARLGERTGRTSVPSIWINQEYIGGLNDGNPGLLPLEDQGLLSQKLAAAAK